MPAGIEAVVLVEGSSDQAALDALAKRFGRDLEAERVSIVPMGGSSGIGDFLGDLLDTQRFAGTLAGLCDEAELGDVQRGLEQAGLGSKLSRRDMETLGFYVCVADLEDELIRSLGVAAVVDVIDGQREPRPIRRTRPSCTSVAHSSSSSSPKSRSGSGSSAPRSTWTQSAEG